MEQKLMLPEDEGYRLLREFGIPVPDHEVVRDVREAEAAAARIGYPVVLKVVSPEIVHKSDAGGVMTGIDTPERLSLAFNGILESVRDQYPDAAITGIIVERETAPRSRALYRRKDRSIIRPGDNLRPWRNDDRAVP